MNRTLLVVVICLLKISATHAQNWEYDGNLLTEEHGLREGSFSGVAVDPEGKIWVVPYFYQTDTLTVTITNVAGTQDSIATNQRASMVYIFNADGTQASFSPLFFLKNKSGVIVDTLGGSISRSFENVNRLVYSYHTLRGIRADNHGNMIISALNHLKKVDYRDGSFLAETDIYQVVGNSRGLAGVAVDKSGNVYAHSTFAGYPIVQYDQNLENPITVFTATSGFSRTNLVSDDGLTMYFSPFSQNEIQVYTRSDLKETFSFSYSITGLKSESMGFDPKGNIWASAGSFNDFPNDPWLPKVHYKFNPSNLTEAPTDSMVWFDKTFYPEHPDASEYQEGRPRGIAFSNDGEKAYLVQFNMNQEFIIQKFVNKSTEFERFTGLKSPTARVKSGETITLPVAISASPSADITSVEFKVAKQLDGATISLSEAFMPQDWMLEINDEGDYISYAAAGTSAFSGEMTALELMLTVSTEVAVQTQLMISDVVFNENSSIPVEVGMLYFDVAVTPEKAIVWPGDTNNDGEVSEVDVLPIGQYYELTGPKRFTEGIAWQGFEADLWETPEATYADAFGDGVITLNDMAGITENFGKIVPMPTQKNTSELSAVTIPIPAVKKGDLIRISLSVGSETNPLQGLLGAALRLVVPVQALAFKEIFPVGLFDASQELIPFMHFNEQNAELSLALMRTRLQGGVNGFGNIAELEFEAIETVPAGLSVELLNMVTSSETSMNYEPIVGMNVIITTSAEHGTLLPIEFRLSQNYPNPFNPSTQISFDVAKNGLVSVEVFSLLGQKVATLMNKELSVGTYSVNFDASNFSSGIYLYKLTADNTSVTKKMMLIK